MSLKASFFTAAKKGDVKELKKLLKEINPNIRNKEGETPLHIVAGRSHLEAVKLLLDHGADPNAQTIHGKTSLHEAARWGRVDVVRLLLERGADFKSRDAEGRTPVDVASASVKNVFVEWEQRRTLSLFDAVTRGDVEGVKLWLERGLIQMSRSAAPRLYMLLRREAMWKLWSFYSLRCGVLRLMRGMVGVLRLCSMRVLGFFMLGL